MPRYFLILILLVPVGLGCFRSWKREPVPVPPGKLPEPQTGAPIVSVRAEEPKSANSVQPPSFDIPHSSIPALPGLPKAEIPSSIPDSPPLAEALEPITAPRDKPDPKAKPMAEARKLVDQANSIYADVPDYECKLVRREVVSGRALPTEELTVAHRKEPFGVYMQVTGDAGKGREMIYAKGQHGGKVFVLTGKGDNALVGVGKKMDLDPDSPLLIAKSRHRIYETGLGNMIAAIGKFVDDAESGKRPAETVKFLGPTEAVESKKPLTTIEVTLKPGDDALLPKGGTRTYGFDADKKSSSYGLPVQIVTTDEKGKEVEFYGFSGYKIPAKLTDADFHPDRLVAKKK